MSELATMSNCDVRCRHGMLRFGDMQIQGQAFGIVIVPITQ